MPGLPLHVLIVGGGIGGLCLAQGLKKAGLSVAVYERDRTRTERLQGYRLYINPLGSRALYNCLPSELYDAFVATCGRPGEKIWILSEQMEALLHIDRSDKTKEAIDRHCSVSRITFRELLLTGLDNIVHFDKTFIRYEETSDHKITVFFEDGTTAAGDVLIAADGANSRVRKQFLPEAERVDTDIRVIAGKVPLSEVMAADLPSKLVGGVSSVMTPRGCGMFIARQEFGNENAQKSLLKEDGELEKLCPGLLFDNTKSYVMWALCAKYQKFGLRKQQQESNGDELLEIAKDTCKNWHPAFRQLLQLSETSTLGQWMIHTSLPIQPWKTQRITLLGDAIHSMPPMGGTGCSIAIRDADLLCQKLILVSQGKLTILEAFQDYEQKMLSYGFEAVQKSLNASKQFVVDNPIAPIFQKTLFRIMNVLPIKEQLFQNLG